MGSRAGERRTGPKCIAIVGPLASGKTSLLEALLARTGAIARQNPVSSGATVGDASPEARDHQMSVEATFATVDFMGEAMTFVDCPGSIEFSGESEAVLPACDLAVVVAEADEKKVPALQLVMRRLEDAGIPRILFVNKVERSEARLRDTLKMLQPASATPLLMRQIPLRRDGIVIGSIDLALERAYVWREHAASEIAAIPDDDRAREVEARFAMLETLADHDDALMEQLLDEIEPPRDAIFDDLAADLREGSITPVLIGSAERGNGVLRLLKTIRHDAPDVSSTARRLGVSEGSVLHVMKTIHTSHGGKLSVARLLSGDLKDGVEFASSGGSLEKVSGLYSLLGRNQTKLETAGPGSTLAIGKLDTVKTGDTLVAGRSQPEQLAPTSTPNPVFAFSLRARERKDEVKLSAALVKLVEEDPSYAVVQNQDTGETVLSGQGEMHLRVAVERLQGRYQIPITTRSPEIPYQETIRGPVSYRARHKKQSGGHGQFGDVLLEIRPLPRGAGFEFTDTITGGAVPKQYIPSVEAGVREFMKAGPLGFPVVDIAVNLADGSFHGVDSSDMAFQMAARLAMREALAKAATVILEPILRIEVCTPGEATARVTAILPQRRGQILGYDSRPGWPGWDIVEALIPQAEAGDLIVELRSATAGVATYSQRFDHMGELTGRTADEVVAAKARAA